MACTQQGRDHITHDLNPVHIYSLLNSSTYIPVYIPTIPWSVVGR